MKIEIIEAIGYSHFASYLVNRDNSIGADNIAECHQWLMEQGLDRLQCVDCSDDQGFGFPDGGGLPGNVATYTFHKFTK